MGTTTIGERMGMICLTILIHVAIHVEVGKECGASDINLTINLRSRHF